MIALAALLLFVFVAYPAHARPGALRLAVVATLAAVITSYFWFPFLLYQDYLSASQYLERWKYDSFGAIDVLTRLLDGGLLDSGRLPVLTVLLALGVAWSVVSSNPDARMALAVFVVCLLLYFGRATWGTLADLVPMHQGLLFHRFIGGVHLGAILLIGIGGEWLWQRFSGFSNPWRSLLPGLIVSILMLPALKERFDFYSLEARSMKKTRVALDTDADWRSILDEVKRLPPGRTYAGFRSNWGAKVTLGDIHFFDLLPFYDITMLGPPYEGLSLNSDVVQHFSELDPTHYDLFDVEYVIAPSNQNMPRFLTPIRKTSRYTLYRANTSGYGAVARSVVSKSADSQATLLKGNKSWLTFGVGLGQFIRWSYPAAEETGASASAPPPLVPARGTVRDQRIGPGLIELQVDARDEALLVVKTSYHPKWSVKVDGRDADFFMVSPSYIGLNIPAGVHHVRLEYRSGILKEVLLFLGAATLLATVLARRKFERINELINAMSKSNGG